MNPPRTLTIAGSDSGGGAGIQADLKAFSSLGCYGMSVLTALTAQNTCQVRAIHDVPVDFIRAQMEAVFEDIGVDAVKIGMLHRSDVIREVARLLEQYQPANIVVDTVMVAKSGDRLLQDEAVSALKETLIPMATLITPNLPECEVLSGASVTNRQEMEQTGKELMNLGPAAVLVKGGHLNLGDVSPDCLVYRTLNPEPTPSKTDNSESISPDTNTSQIRDSKSSNSIVNNSTKSDSVTRDSTRNDSLIHNSKTSDLLAHNSKTSDSATHVQWFEFPRIKTRNNHGTGCTLSSAITAGLARGLTVNEAVEQALAYLNTALEIAVDWRIGEGHGPVHHFHRWWK